VPPNLETAVAWQRDNASPMLTEFVEVARRALSLAIKETIEQLANSRHALDQVGESLRRRPEARPQ